MRLFISTLPRNIITCFEGRIIVWHATAIALTAVLVISGFDWLYFRSTRSPMLWHWMFPAVPIGGLVPIALPLILLTIGSLSRSAKASLAGWAVGQAELVGALVAAGYKAITGRVHPARSLGPDISHMFRFGFWRGGVFWGWPSSHTTMAFAMAATIFTLFPKRRWPGCVAFIYALYIGVGVSTTIHWFSDFASGAIIGTMVGTVVGRNFLCSKTYSTCRFSRPDFCLPGKNGNLRRRCIASSSILIWMRFTPRSSSETTRRCAASL